jgi:hypothetical protein
MAEAHEGSFSLDDFERIIVENAAALPNVDNLTTCNCRGYCLREKGQNFCPCKSFNSFCSEACHGDGFSCCMNKRRVQESDSDDTDTVRTYKTFFALKFYKLSIANIYKYICNLIAFLTKAKFAIFGVLF